MKPASHTIKESSLDKAAYAAQSARDRIEKSNVFYKIFGNYEFNRYGIIAMLLLWNVCLGGVAVQVGAMNSIPQLILLVFPTMGLLTWILAVQPMKTILQIAAVATVLDIAVIIYNLI